MSNKRTNNTDEYRDQLIQQMQFLGQMSSTETALFHQTAAASHGLGITDMKTISVLTQEGPHTAGQLADRLSLTSGAITNVIDRLERRGLLDRKPDPKDRRKVVVVANEAKLASMGSIYDGIGEAFTALTAHYTIEQLEFLVSHLKDTIEITKQQIARLKDQQ
jgi:DNA-binding MarR family transcriptional regulator